MYYKQWRRLKINYLDLNVAFFIRRRSKMKQLRPSCIGREDINSVWREKSHTIATCNQKCQTCSLDMWQQFYIPDHSTLRHKLRQIHHIDEATAFRATALPIKPFWFHFCDSIFPLNHALLHLKNEKKSCIGKRSRERKTTFECYNFIASRIRFEPCRDPSISVALSLMQTELHFALIVYSRHDVSATPSRF
jgi:hypothetical protein